MGCSHQSGMEKTTMCAALQKRRPSRRSCHSFARSSAATPRIPPPRSAACIARYAESLVVSYSSSAGCARKNSQGEMDSTGAQHGEGARAGDQHGLAFANVHHGLVGLGNIEEMQSVTSLGEGWGLFEWERGCGLRVMAVLPRVIETGFVSARTSPGARLDPRTDALKRSAASHK